jgi:hypothetical protein
MRGEDDGKCGCHIDSAVHSLFSIFRYFVSNGLHYENCTDCKFGWFFASLARWLVVSLRCWLVALLARCVVGSLRCWLVVGSLADRWRIVGSLDRWIVALRRSLHRSLLRCFIRSLLLHSFVVASFVRCWSLVTRRR